MGSKLVKPDTTLSITNIPNSLLSLKPNRTKTMKFSKALPKISKFCRNNQVKSKNFKKTSKSQTKCLKMNQYLPC